MERLYTIKGYKGNNERYIQLGDAGRPVIQTKTGYRADRVIVFESRNQAYEFIVNFINDRQRVDIKWSAVEYKPSRSSDTLVGMIKNECRFNVVAPGEIRVDYSGTIRKKFYNKRYATLDGNDCPFYCRGC